MRALFWCEIQHYWRQALVAFVLFLFGLTYFQYASPSSAISMPYSLIWGCALILAGGFGSWQSFYHKSQGRWTFLLHRPIEIHHIYLALLLSALTLLFIVIALPVLLITLYTQFFTQQLVENRDYFFIVVVYASSMCIYLVATLTMLAVNKGAILILATLGILSVSHVASSALGAILPLLIVILVLIYLNVRSFKPDLSTPPQKPLEIVLSYIMMSIGLHILVVVCVSIIFSIYQLTSSPAKDAPVDHFTAFNNATTGAERMSIALGNSEHTMANHLRNQSTLANTARVSLNDFQFPYYNMTPDRSADAILSDPKRGREWQLSHNQGVFVGFEKATGKRVGWLSPDGIYLEDTDHENFRRFENVPVPVNDTVLMTHTTIYAVNFDYETISTIYQTEAGEQFIGLPRLVHGYIRIPTTHRLLMFNPVMLEQEQTTQPAISIGYPVNSRQIEDIWLYELADGFSAIFTGHHMFGYEEAGTVVTYQPFYAQSEIVEQKAQQAHSQPLWYRQIEEIISPLTLYLSDVTRYALNPNTVENSAPLEPLSRFKMVSVHAHIAAMQILSVLISLFISTKLNLSKKNQITWALLAGLFGVTVCLAMLIMYFLPNPKRALSQAFYLKQFKLSLAKRAKNA